jgi:2-dehydro-3-deoxygalactonokinase
VTSFRTVMTGELFSLLSKHSILSQWLHTSVTVGEAFRAGVRQGMRGQALSTELFSIRASVLLGRREAHEAASFASGLLIGADVRTGLGDAEAEAEIVVMGRPELTRLYLAALEEAGRSAREVDGERAFLAGIQALVKEIA